MNKKVIFSILGLISLGVGGFVLYKKFGKKNDLIVSDTDQPTLPSSSTTTKSTFPLKSGSNNADVKLLQKALNTYYTQRNITSIAQLTVFIFKCMASQIRRK